MSQYFQVFPTVDYDILKNGSTINVPNITLRFKINELLRNKLSVFYDYSIKDGEKPETISYKYYGDTRFHWFVFMVNQILDPQYEWVLNNFDFANFIVNKYGSIAAAQSTIHEYRQIIATERYSTTGVFIPQQEIIVDLTTYNTLAPTSRIEVTAYDYEVALNESRRQIRVLDSQYISDIEEEMKRIFE